MAAALSADRLDLTRLLVRGPEAIRKEGWQFDLFLAYETALRQRALAKQVDRGADTRRGGDLDRRQRSGLAAVGEDLACKHLLHQRACALSGDGHEHQHHVLHRA